jgi:hypothetical protein
MYRNFDRIGGTKILLQYRIPIPRRAGVGSMQIVLGYGRQINDAVVFIGWTLRVKSKPRPSSNNA